MPPFVHNSCVTSTINCTATHIPVSFYIVIIIYYDYYLCHHRHYEDNELRVIPKSIQSVNFVGMAHKSYSENVAKCVMRVKYSN